MAGNDKDDGGTDNTPSEKHPGSDRLASKQPSEKHRNNRIHIGVRLRLALVLSLSGAKHRQ